MTLVGQVYYDIDKNGRYSPPPKGRDKAIAREGIYLVDLGARGRAPSSLGNTVTNSVGRFKMLIDQPKTTINGGIKLDLLSNDVIATVKIQAGSNEKNIPLVQPTKVSSLSVERPSVSDHGLIKVINLLFSARCDISGLQFQQCCDRRRYWCRRPKACAAVRH